MREETPKPIFQPQFVTVSSDSEDDLIQVEMEMLRRSPREPRTPRQGTPRVNNAPGNNPTPQNNQQNNAQN